MSDGTQIPAATTSGPAGADDLLPLVFDELRKLAAQRLAQEKPGQTLQPTALVNEAYLRLVGANQAGAWNSRGHFFAAAAEAMRRILVDNARRKATLRHGGELRRVDLDDVVPGPTFDDRPESLLALDGALAELERYDEPAARLVKLRYFAGLTHQQAAEALGLGRRAADRLWALARAWLYQQLNDT